jgi:uncharacterized membrane protein
MNALIKMTIFLSLLMPISLAAAVENAGQTYDLGIESMRSHNYSVGIFIFLLISILVFLFILSAFWRNSKGASIKTGEKVLLGMIVVGVFIAIAFAAAQLLDGFLF